MLPATAEWQERAALSGPFQPASGDSSRKLRLHPFNLFSRTSFFQNKKDLLRSHKRNRGNRHFLTKLLFVRDGDDKHSAFVEQLRTKC
jgi:hypothetical protein